MMPDSCLECCFLSTQKGFCCCLCPYILIFSLKIEGRNAVAPYFHPLSHAQESHPSPLWWGGGDKHGDHTDGYAAQDNQSPPRDWHTGTEREQVPFCGGKDKAGEASWRLPKATLMATVPFTWCDMSKPSRAMPGLQSTYPRTILPTLTKLLLGMARCLAKINKWKKNQSNKQNNNNSISASFEDRVPGGHNAD